MEITIIDDQQREGDETFTLALEVYPYWGPGLPITLQPGDTTAVTMTIRDNDGSGGGGGGGGRGGGGGGRGGGDGGRDRHGNSAAQATRIAFRPATPRSGSIAGRINTRRDVDYFRLRLAQAGVLVIETTGSTDTRATVWQAREEVGAATGGGPGTNFRLATPVEAGDVVIAIAGEGGRTGGYTLRARLVVSHLENPRPASFQSGLGVISGWVCEGEGVTVEIEREDGEVVELTAAYGTERADTAAVCGDTANGFGLLFNWNLLGDGAHAVGVLVDGIELGRAAVTVTTLGAEFVEGLAGSLLVDRLSPRRRTEAGGVARVPAELRAGSGGVGGGTCAPAPSSGGIEGVLENPTPASYQSGIGVISGWVCAGRRSHHRDRRAAHRRRRRYGAGRTRWIRCGDVRPTALACW